jgi:hypothetical protein
MLPEIGGQIMKNEIVSCITDFAVQFVTHLFLVDDGEIDQEDRKYKLHYDEYLTWFDEGITILQNAFQYPDGFKGGKVEGRVAAGQPAGKQNYYW